MLEAELGRISAEHRAARAEAIEQGLKVYEGKACSTCSSTKRYISNGGCSHCASQRVKQRYWSDPEFADKVKARATERARSNRASVMLDQARRRAHQNGIPFLLEVGSVEIPERCPVLGIPLDCSDRNHTPSLDRIDNSKGYVPKNVAIISMRANRLKSDASLAELEALVAYMTAQPSFDVAKSCRS